MLFGLFFALYLLRIGTYDKKKDDAYNREIARSIIKKLPLIQISNKEGMKNDARK